MAFLSNLLCIDNKIIIKGIDTMRIRFGYVAMAIDLKDCSPSKTITYTQYNKIQDEEVKLYRLKSIAEENLKNTKRIILYNIAHNIKVYRLTSKLIPLVTHPDVLEWDYRKELSNLFDELRELIFKNNLRISAHPDHFTIISSPKDEVVKYSIKDLEYHNNIMESLGLDTSLGKLVLHIGGKYSSKDKTLERFKENFRRINKDISGRLILENDDKTYDTLDVLSLCEDMGCPMVLDIHHHLCNNRNDTIGGYLQRIFDTWSSEKLVPKIHISSPKSSKNIRAHADNIDFNSFYDFIKVAKDINKDFDIMIEAKNKNLALLDLMKNIKENKYFNVINESTIEN